VTELLPSKAAFAEGDDVTVEVRGLERTTTLSLWRLAEEVASVTVSPDEPIASFGVLDPGGYGVEADCDAATALDVLRRPLERLRYGFVSDYSAGRDTDAVADNLRRFHLNAVQFYDWMYRHARLLPPAPEFADSLGRSVSLDTVVRLVAAVREAGSAPLGYAAVYAVGEEELSDWESELLLHPDGTPWTLADFLWIVDPSGERWLDHFTAELREATARVGFAGFHLDQYGAPKRARRADGVIVDLASAFVELIARVRAALPDSLLVFNNVNDFPTEATAAAPQDATYIEPWAPHTELSHLAELARTAAAAARGRPVALAAYLSAFRGGDDGALAALRLELASVFAHGAGCLLFGEADAILVDPYYANHAHLDEEGRRVAKAYLDFAVRYGDLLFAADTADLSRTHAGGINEEVRVGGAAVSADCLPGTVWSRITEARDRRIVSLVDLTAQNEVVWDAPKRWLETCSGLSIAFERTAESRYFFASPEGAPRALELPAKRERWHDVVEVPAFTAWALVWSAAGDGGQSTPAVD
jgi:dextranase